MKSFNIDYDLANPEKGFSKAQLMNLTYKDLERLSMMENPEIPEKNKDSAKNKEKTGPNDGGPRPPKEEDFPEDDPFPEVSNPNGKDN